MKAVVYTRVSHLDQVENGSSLDTQLDRIQDFCKFKGVEIIEHYKDAGISGRKFENRPNFVRMMQRVERGDIHAIVVYSLSRFGRNIRETLNYLEKLEKWGVSFYAIDLGIDTSTSHGKLIMQIMSALSEFESNQMSDRIRAVMGNNKSKKMTYCGNPPLGYDNVDGVMRPKEKEIEIVKSIFDMHEKNISMNEIARQLNKKGYKSKKGSKFYAVTIQKILNNDIYKELA